MVPFFLQIRGPGPSMLALYNSQGQTNQSLARRLLRIEHTPRTAPQVAITVKRQVVLHLDGLDVARSYIIGTGSMRTVPPGYVPTSVESDILTTDYEGEIQFTASVTVGGFDVGRMRVSVSELR